MRMPPFAPPAGLAPRAISRLRLALPRSPQLKMRRFSPPLQCPTRPPRISNGSVCSLTGSKAIALDEVAHTAGASSARSSAAGCRLGARQMPANTGTKDRRRREGGVLIGQKNRASRATAPRGSCAEVVALRRRSWQRARATCKGHLRLKSAALSMTVLLACGQGWGNGRRAVEQGDVEEERFASLYLASHTAGTPAPQQPAPTVACMGARVVHSGLVSCCHEEHDPN